ncbi:polyamine aminopropyltransferase [Thiomicrospira microaerophila]|uniref:polyamine aminopropyltransferase n=1 Tax=Thiomicrospira microaerophila TaxID=406020 RepID=UPI0005CA19D6|nr:polyamine aminopropyltransferase [Thiomicrospira microaerophila]
MSELSYLETLHPSWGQSFVMDEVLFESKTEHQHLVIFRNAQWGTVMALDGVIQTTEGDEFIYHEMLTHVPMFSHPNPKSVLIIGGGDGGILREVLKHASVETVTMVEIDAQVVEMCKTYLPNHSQGAFDDPRLNLVIADGVEFVNQTKQTFDVVISDSTDPVGPGEVLFTSRFYQGIASCLNPDGVFVAQNGVSFLQQDEVKNTALRLKPLFQQRGFYCAAVPTYVGGVMSFAWATQQQDLSQQALAQVVARYQTAAIKTRYYTPALHQACFALPQYLNELID